MYPRSKVTQDNKSLILCLSICTFIFLCIGLPTYFTGCERTLQPNCSLYWIKETTVVDYGVKSHQCSRCIHTSKVCTTDKDGKQKCTTKCDVYEYYQCYNSYDVENYITNSGKTRTCNFYADYNNRIYEYALRNAINKFPLGSNYDRYIDKNTGICYTATKIVSLAIVGFTFLLLAAVSIVVIFSLLIYLYKDDIFSFFNFRTNYISEKYDSVVPVSNVEYVNDVEIF